MAKEIPYFKFFTGEWANGEITAESYEVQGVFINICSLYWNKEGSLKLNFVRKKFKANEAIDQLLESEIIKLEGDYLRIGFLDEQLSECESIRLRNSKAGKASASKRKSNTRSTPVEHPLNTPSTNKRREDKEKIREDNSKEEKVLKKFDETSFTNTEMRLKTSKENIRIKLQEFLEIEKLTPQFKNKQEGEILKHFRNWLNYNKPKEVNIKDNSVPSWVKYAKDHE